MEDVGEETIGKLSAFAQVEVDGRNVIPFDVRAKVWPTRIPLGLGRPKRTPPQA